MCTKFLRASQTLLSINERTQRRPQTRPQHHDLDALDSQMSMQSTHTLAISAVMAAPTFQRDCNFTDCHPFSPVDSFDQKATSASAIEASIPEASYRLPCRGVVSSDKDYCPPALIPSPSATRYSLHTTWTSPMAALLLCSEQRPVSSRRPISQPSTNLGIPPGP